jgi:Raf kinase inhibitor-like YbhB/YbcL family protein
MPVKNFVKPLLISSADFSEGSFLPADYTCDGKNISPPLSIKAVPKETQSIVLILEDPDAPGGVFDHWIVYNIPPDTITIEEGSTPGTETLNSSGRKGYMGPCPPSGTHHYVFKVYALDTLLDFEEEPTKRKIEKAMEGHILAKGEMTTVYNRNNKK